MRKVLVLTALLFAFLSPASAISNAIVPYSFVWDGLTRNCNLVIPSNMPAIGAELIVTLHGVKHLATPDVTDYYGWDFRAKQTNGGFMVAACSATHDPDTCCVDPTGYLVWNAMFFDDMVFSAPPYPDDEGFLRQLVSNLTATYHLNPKKIYAVGFSAGAFMSARVAAKLSDVFAAVQISSGGLQSTLNNPTVTPPTDPISVLEYHGTIDTNAVGVDPCAQIWTWNKT